MDALVRTAPPPGSADPGDLYIEAQSRTLWLGVDEGVDPSGFLLISDIVATQLEIEATLVEAKAYADQQDELRALVVHTHVASDISDFEDAVEAVVGGGSGSSGGFTRGMILMWSGSIAEIGVGALANWSLCDGTNGTPDLRDRFIIGAGNKLPGDTNPLSTVKTDVAGGHTHTINGTALSIAQMPSHYHYTVLGPHRAYGATYGGAGAHNHSIFGPHWTGSYMEHDSSDEGDRGVHVNSYTHGSSTNGAHEHSVYIDIHIGMNSNSQGSGAAHTHTESTAGSHDHNLTSNQVRDVLPFYALAYIMKL